MSALSPRPVPARRPLGVVALLLSLLVGATLLAILPGAAAQAVQERQARPSPSAQPLANAQSAKQGPDTPSIPADCFGPAQVKVDPFPCPLVTFKPKRPTILLWGDSHAWQYIPALRQAVRGNGVNLVSFVAGSCAPSAVKEKDRMGTCERSNLEAYRTVRKWHQEGRDLRVILSSNWSGFRIAYRRMMLGDIVPVDDYSDYTKEMVRLSHEGTPKLFTRLGRLGVDVDVIGPSAVVPDKKLPCLAGEEPYQCDLPRWRALPEESDTREWLGQQMAKLQGKPKLIDATGAYCSRTVCHGKVGDILTWYDHLHLSATRTRNLRQFFAPTVAAVKR